MQDAPGGSPAVLAGVAEVVDARCVMLCVVGIASAWVVEVAGACLLENRVCAAGWSGKEEGDIVDEELGIEVALEESVGEELVGGDPTGGKFVEEELRLGEPASQVPVAKSIRKASLSVIDELCPIIV